MPTITAHYGITRPVPFEDVRVEADNKLFVDPHAIRLSAGPDPFKRLAVESMDTFLQSVTECIIDGSPSAMRRGEALLQRFAEPWETRLGMACDGFAGHGGAELVGSWIWNALREDVEALVRIGVLGHVEDIPLFVEGIDRDITSDITTRIVFAALADFTASVVNSYPEFTATGHQVRAFERQIWNVAEREWENAYLELPVVNGRPLLLVPRTWVRRNLLMSAGRFYETAVLSYAQFEQIVITNDGKRIKIRKDDLKRQPGLGRGRSTNLAVTMRAIGNEDDLLAEFKRFVAERVEPGEDGDQGAA